MMSFGIKKKLDTRTLFDKPTPYTKKKHTRTEAGEMGWGSRVMEAIQVITLVLIFKGALVNFLHL